MFDASIPLPRRSRLTGRFRPTPVAIRVANEILIGAVATLLYFVVRGLVDGREADAFANAAWLIDLERRLGVFWEPHLQAWTLEHDWLVRLANAVYVWGHWPLIAATLVWLLLAHRDHVALYRNAMLVSGAIGLVCFVALPLAPPRFLADWGFVDTVSLQTESYRVLQPPALTNQYAAMPSLHVGWNLLMGIAIVRHASTGSAKAFGLLMPLAIWVATVLTANHYLADGLVGSVVALVGLGGALLLRRRAVSSTRSVDRAPGCRPPPGATVDTERCAESPTRRHLHRPPRPWSTPEERTSPPAWPGGALPERTVTLARFALLVAPLVALALAYLLSAAFRSEVGEAARVLRQGDADALRDYLLSYGAWAPVASLLLMVAQAVVAPVPAFVVAFANGLAFGVVWGGLLSLVGQALAAAVCFAIARSLGRRPVASLAGRLGWAAADGWFARRGAYGVLLARLVPGMAFDAISYAAGLTGIGFRRFLAATVLGTAPQAFAYAYLGQHAPRYAWALLAVTGLTAGGAVATTLVRRRHRPIAPDRPSAAAPPPSPVEPRPTRCPEAA